NRASVGAIRPSSMKAGRGCSWPTVVGASSSSMLFAAGDAPLPTAVHRVREEEADASERVVRAGLRDLFLRRRKVAELIAHEDEDLCRLRRPRAFPHAGDDLVASLGLRVLRRLLQAEPVVIVPD